MENIPEPEPSTHQGRRGAPRSEAEKKIILQVFKCLERDHPRPKDELIEMCSDYTGVSKSSVYKILREVKLYGVVLQPKPGRGRGKIKIEDIL